MDDELWSTLPRFHREIAMPDIIANGIQPLRAELASFKRETHANFDSVSSRFDRLDIEYHALSAAVKRIEQRLDNDK